MFLNSKHRILNFLLQVLQITQIPITTIRLSSKNIFYFFRKLTLLETGPPRFLMNLTLMIACSFLKENILTKFALVG